MDSVGLYLLFVLLVGAISWAAVNRLNRKRSGLSRDYYRASWKKVLSYRDSGGTGFQLAVLEADKLLDHALKARRIAGATMGDRLNMARGVFTDNNAVWKAHKLRNRLAHEQVNNLNFVVVNKALAGFKKALKDLGAL